LGEAALFTENSQNEQTKKAGSAKKSKSRLKNRGAVVQT
jgi:hypothetical protein